MYAWAIIVYVSWADFSGQKFKMSYSNFCEEVLTFFKKRGFTWRGDGFMRRDGGTYLLYAPSSLDAVKCVVAAQEFARAFPNTREEVRMSLLRIEEEDDLLSATDSILEPVIKRPFCTDAYRDLPGKRDDGLATELEADTRTGEHSWRETKA